MKVYKDSSKEKYYIEAEVENERRKSNMAICIVVAIILIIYNIAIFQGLVVTAISNQIFTSGEFILYLMALTVNVPAIMFWYAAYVQIKTKEKQYITLDSKERLIGRYVTREYGKRKLRSENLYPLHDIYGYEIILASDNLASDVFASDPESFEYFYKTESGVRKNNSTKLLHKKMGVVKFKTEIANHFDYLVVSASFEKGQVLAELEQLEQMINNIDNIDENAFETFNRK